MLKTNKAYIYKLPQCVSVLGLFWGLFFVVVVFVLFLNKYLLYLYEKVTDDSHVQAVIIGYETKSSWINTSTKSIKDNLLAKTDTYVGQNKTSYLLIISEYENQQGKQNQSMY